MQRLNLEGLLCNDYSICLNESSALQAADKHERNLVVAEDFTRCDLVAID